MKFPCGIIDFEVFSHMHSLHTAYARNCGFNTFKHFSHCVSCGGGERSKGKIKEFLCEILDLGFYFYFTKIEVWLDVQIFISSKKI